MINTERLGLFNDATFEHQRPAPARTGVGGGRGSLLELSSQEGAAQEGMWRKTSPHPAQASPGSGESQENGLSAAQLKGLSLSWGAAVLYLEA